MEEILATLKAIPAAAASPLALVAYLATVGAWTLIAWRVRRHSALLAHLHHLPEKDRITAIQMELGYVDVPKGLTAEQYLRSRIHSFVFAGYIALCVTGIVIAGMAFYKRNDAKDRADEYIREILDSPRTGYMSSTNVLSNGKQMVEEAAAEVRPPLSKGDLADLVDRLAIQRMNGAQINERLKQMSGTGRLQKANDVLGVAAKTVDDAFEKLADCFRSVMCAPGKEFARMCKTVLAIRENIAASNGSASKIPGVMMNLSGGPMNFGDGSMDVSFRAVSAINVEYLSKVVCGAKRGD
jgi:hypothetical protein